MTTIGFAGCSFTYGDGLDYYEGSKETSRFSHLVASHFNIESLNQSFRGGSHTQIIKWWESFFQDNTVDAFVFQITMWMRSDSPVVPGTSHIDVMRKHEKTFVAWLEEHDITLDDYLEQSKRDDVLHILNFLQKHQHKFPIYILCWPSIILPYIKEHEWFLDKMIPLHYKNETYETISDLMGNPLRPIKLNLLTEMLASIPKSLSFDGSKNLIFNTGEIFQVVESLRPELTIATDYVNFKKSRRDYHPSKLCHEVIAQSIITRMEHDNIFQTK